MSSPRAPRARVLNLSAPGALAWLCVGLLGSACSDGGPGQRADIDSQRVSDAAITPVDGGRRPIGYVPSEDTLPPLPVRADAGSPVFFGPQNPVVYLNDYPRAVYTDAYIFALAANKDIDLRGVISSGVDCHCSAGDNYPVTNTPEVRTQWIAASRDAGFQNIPDNVNGTQGPTLVEPDSGVIGDTVRIGSPGSDLILSEASKATPDKPLVIIAGGPITTLADAYLADPSISKRVVVSWLVGLDAASLDDWNGRADFWATQIVLRSFRVFVFPTELDPPHVPVARMIAEFPDNDLRKLLLNAGYHKPDYDSDGQPAVVVRLPSFIVSYERRALLDGLTMALEPAGNLWVMTRGDGVAAGEEFFRALNTAFGTRDAGR